MSEMSKNELMPLIIWCETFQDLEKCESYTDVYFTEEGYDTLGGEGGRLKFPLVYFRNSEYFDKYGKMLFDDETKLAHNKIYDYDLYESSICDTIEDFREMYYDKIAEEENLIKLKPEDIPILYPEYLIWIWYKNEGLKW